MTLVEALVACSLLGLALLVTAEGTEYVRDQLKTTRTLEVLGRLDEAMTAYRDATGHWPEEREEAERWSDGETDRWGEGGMANDEIRMTNPRERAARRVLAALRSVPAARVVVERLWAETQHGPDGFAIRDAWGRPLQCLTAQSRSATDRKAVAAHGGRPIFLSSGPGGDLHGPRSDELPR